MAEININGSPYFDRFDPDNERSKVLFRPDRYLQQSELNELQSIAENNLRRLGDRIFSDGAIQTGMAFSIDGTAGTITIEDGLVYLAGKVRTFKQQSIAFTGTGTENIGIKMNQTIVTHVEDPGLLDPTQNVPSHMSEGADRLVEEVILTVNDDSAPTIYQFNDGALFLDPDRPEFTQINTVLAQRTFEESGSYQVSGFNIWTEKSQDSGKVDLVIDRGTAYVLGYRISKPTSTRIPLEKSINTRNVVQETHTYSGTSRKNRVGSNYVQEVTQVVARTESPSAGINISKGTTDGRDAIPTQYTNIDRNTVVLWTPEKVYTYGSDFTILEDSGVPYVNWDTGLNGTEPTSGTTYKMTFEYDRVMTKGTDYVVTTTAIGEDVPGWYTDVDFGATTGVKPKDTGTVRVDYSYYLARADVVTLDATGNFTIIQGQPDRDGTVQPPTHTDPLTLKIGNVYIYPNSDIAKASNTAIMNLRMEDLQKLKKRLENVEYNQAVTLLETEATMSEDPLALRGVFVDGFTDFTKMDSALTSVAFSLEDASITLVVNTPADQMKRPSYLAGSSYASTWGRLVTAPFTERKEINQPLASQAWNVNPYAVYNKQGVLTLTPASDNWIEQDKITVNDVEFVTTTMNKWWRHQRLATDPNGKLSEFNQNLVDNTVLDNGAEWEDFKYKATAEGTMISTAQETRESAIEFMRVQELQFSATNLQPMANNLFVTFDGVRVPVTPTGSTAAGMETGTIRADGSGVASGKFNIPAGIRTGTREVTLQNDGNMATTTFTAQGTRKITTETITKTRVTFNLYDPLAQSFAFPTARVISSVGVYFASKSDTDNIIMQIRGLSEGGLPNRTVYAERTLTPADINVSADASVETKIALDDPLMANAGENYCIVFITDSNQYTMWLAKLGDPLLGSATDRVVSQPYVNGVLFSSSNAVSWTVHNECDLKFSVYTAEFAEQGVIEFDTMTAIDSDGILLLASYLTPANTGCYWEVKTIAASEVGSVSIDSVPWQPLSNYTEKEMNYVVGAAKLRATFKSNRYISPVLALDDLLFVNFVTETTGDYVTKTINQTEAPFNQITLSYDAAAPAGSSVTPSYSLDGGATWKPFTATPTTAKASAEFTRYTFVERVSTTATNTSIKYKLTLEGENRFIRPRVRRFTALTTDAI